MLSDNKRPDRADMITELDKLCPYRTDDVLVAQRTSSSRIAGYGKASSRSATATKTGAKARSRTSVSVAARTKYGD
jgi:hypothetical protein